MANICKVRIGEKRPDFCRSPPEHAQRFLCDFEELTGTVRDDTSNVVVLYWPRVTGPAFSQERLRQGLGKAQFAVVCYREEVHVPGRAPDQAEGGQRATPDDHDLNVAATRLQLIGQRAEQNAGRLISDLRVSERELGRLAPGRQAPQERVTRGDGAVSCLAGG